MLASGNKLRTPNFASSWHTGVNDKPTAVCGGQTRCDPTAEAALLSLTPHGPARHEPFRPPGSKHSELEAKSEQPSVPPVRDCGGRLTTRTPAKALGSSIGSQHACRPRRFRGAPSPPLPTSSSTKGGCPHPAAAPRAAGRGGPRVPPGQRARTARRQPAGCSVNDLESQGSGAFRLRRARFHEAVFFPLPVSISRPEPQLRCQRPLLPPKALEGGKEGACRRAAG